MEEVEPLSQGLPADHGGVLLLVPEDLLRRNPWEGVGDSFIHSGRLSFWRDLLIRNSASEGVLSTTALRRSFSGTWKASKELGYGIAGCDLCLVKISRTFLCESLESNNRRIKQNGMMTHA